MLVSVPAGYSQPALELCDHPTREGMSFVFLCRVPCCAWCISRAAPRAQRRGPTAPPRPGGGARGPAPDVASGRGSRPVASRPAALDGSGPSCVRGARSRGDAILRCAPAAGEPGRPAAPRRARAGLAPARGGGHVSLRDNAVSRCVHNVEMTLDCQH